MKNIIWKAAYYNMKTITVLCAFMLALAPVVTHAQQEPMYGQYIFNSTVINPAQAGANDSNYWGVLARNQWVGIDGAPRTESVYANFGLRSQIGLAFGIYQDRLGPEHNLYFQTDISYHARLSESWRLAGGVRLIGSHFRVNLTDIPNVEPGDPYLGQDRSSGLLLNIGAGLLAYNEKSFFGLSMPRVFKSYLNVLNSQAGNAHPDIDFRQHAVRDLFAYAGTNIDLTDEITFIPSTLFKYPVDAPVQLDLNAVFGYNDMLDFGPLVRTNLIEMNDWFDAVGFLVGIRFLPNWYFGYMYEYPLTSLSHATRQTHEVSLRFFWDPKEPERVGSPRYFLF